LDGLIQSLSGDFARFVVRIAFRLLGRAAK
jgi:hypothetical protein